MRQRKEWEILCEMAEQEPHEFQTPAGLWVLTGNGTSRQEMKTILRGLAMQGLIDIKNAHDGMRIFRVPGALIEFHLDGWA